MIISIGYRVNSKVATKFRQRATQTLKQHITQGFTINEQYLKQNYKKFIQAVDEIKNLTKHQNLPVDDILELVKLFSQTRFSIDAFDRGKIITNKQTQKNVKVQAKELYTDLLKLKKDLLTRDEATDFFAQERSRGEFEGIFGNVFQSAFGEDVYPSVESKASHLLYFIVKNHPFVDGNKRAGAFAFIWFLQKAQVSFKEKITPEALTVLTLLIATSNPKDKEKLIDLIIMLL
jgi:death-on-curing family protein